MPSTGDGSGNATARPRGGRRAAWRCLALAAMLAAGALAASPALAAEAQDWQLVNAAGVPATTFGSSDAVFISGVVSSGSEPPAVDVYVTANQDWSARDGDSLADITTPHGTPTAVTPDLVAATPIALPHLRIGGFDVVIDRDRNGVYDNGTDAVIGYGSGAGFTVTFGDDANAFDKAQLKSGFANPWFNLSYLAQGLASSLEFWEIPGTPGGLAHMAAGPIMHVPVDAPGDVPLAVAIDGPLTLVNDKLPLWAGKPGTDDLERATRSLRDVTSAIVDDPADPDYRVVAPYIAPASRADEAFPREPLRGFAVLSNRMAEAAAYSSALLHALERFDGAAAAGKPAYEHLQALAVRDYSDALSAKMGAVDAAATALAANLRAAGVIGSFVQEFNDHDRILANQARIRADGFSSAELQAFQTAGLSAAQIDRIRTTFLALSPFVFETDLANHLEIMTGNTDAAQRALLDLATQAGNILDQPIGSPPVANPDTVPATTGEASTFNVLANDTDADGDGISLTTTTDPAHGTVACSSDGTCTYTSDPHFSGGDSFSYTAEDARGFTATGTVAITVAVAPNRRPVAVDDSGTVATQGVLDLDVVANDSDADGDQLTLAGSTAAAHGTVTCPTGGTICTYAGNAGYSGPDSFRYTISDGRGGEATATVAITVVTGNQFPSVELGPDLTVDEGSSFELAPTAGDPDGTLARYSWVLGDGRTLDTPGPITVAYPDDGMFEITLTVTDDLGYSAADSIEVTVRNVAPTVSFTSPYVRIPTGGARAFQAFATDPGADPLTYTWSFGDGSSASGPQVTHAWATAGTYPVTVTVNDGDGGLTSVAQQVVVAPATADAGPDQVADEGSVVTLGGSASSPPDGDTTFRWAFGDGSPGADGATAAHTYADDGTYTATLTVSDDAGSATDTTVVTVRNVAPAITGLVVPTELVAGQTGSFQADAADPGPDDVVALTWDFGDGSHAGGAAVSHAYALPGTYEVTATAADGDGGSTTATRSVDVIAGPSNPPTANGLALTTREDTNAPLTLSGSDPDGTPLTFQVGTPAHGTLTGLAPNLVYVPDHDYNGHDSFTFTVSDGSSTSAPATVAITIVAAQDPPVIADPGPQTVDEGTQLVVPVIATDPDGDVVKLVLIKGPKGMTLSAGALRWLPGESDGPGSFAAVVEARDGHGGVVRRTIAIAVHEVEVAPSITLSSARVTTHVGGRIGSVTITLQDPDIPRPVLALSATGLPAGLHVTSLRHVALDRWQATLAGVTAGAAGTYTATLAVSDGAGGSDTATLTVVVGARP